MHFGMPNMAIVVPHVGADAPIAAMLTFTGLLNLQSSIIFFFFPMRIWVNKASRRFCWELWDCTRWWSRKKSTLEACSQAY